MAFSGSIFSSISGQFSKFYINTFTIPANASPFDLAITGVGFTPKFLIFQFLHPAIATRSIHGQGLGDGTTEMWSSIDDPETVSTSSYIIDFVDITSNLILRAVIKSFDSDGFTLTFDDTSAVGYTNGVGYIAFA